MLLINYTILIVIVRKIFLIFLIFHTMIIRITNYMYKLIVSFVVIDSKKTKH